MMRRAGWAVVAVLGFLLLVAQIQIIEDRELVEQQRALNNYEVANGK